MDDFKVTLPEWKKLVETVVRVGALGAIPFFGLQSAGIEVSAMSVAAGAYVADIIFNKMKIPESEVVVKKNK